MTHDAVAVDPAIKLTDVDSVMRWIESLNLLDDTRAVLGETRARIEQAVACRGAITAAVPRIQFYEGHAASAIDDVETCPSFWYAEVSITLNHEWHLPVMVKLAGDPRANQVVHDLKYTGADPIADAAVVTADALIDRFKSGHQ